MHYVSSDIITYLGICATLAGCAGYIIGKTYERTRWEGYTRELEYQIHGSLLTPKTNSVLPEFNIHAPMPSVKPPMVCDPPQRPVTHGDRPCLFRHSKLG